jgi:hypothetical protein
MTAAVLGGRAMATSRVLLLAVVLAGCLGPHRPDAAPPSAPAGLPEDPATAQNGTAFRDGTDPPASGGPRPVTSTHLVGHPGGEPNIGITSDGALFVSSDGSGLGSNDAEVLRSRDGGVSWEMVQSHTMPGVVHDPMLWVDTETDRVYSAPMEPGPTCAVLYWSDDRGDTWDAADSAVCNLPELDHQKLATGRPGPAANAAAGAAWPTVAYLCYNAVATTNCAVSYDGGRSWPVNGPVQANNPGRLAGGPDLDGTTDCRSGMNGHPAVAPDGTVAFARTEDNCPRPLVALSRDSGLTWETRAGPDSPHPLGMDPEVAFTTDGVLYMLFEDARSHSMLGRSPDLGRTWRLVDVTPPGIGSAAFNALAAGSPGRLAIAFLGSNATGGPTGVPAQATWDLYILTTEDAGDASPAFVSYRVTDDPVERGPIWDDSRRSNLLDFIDGAIAPDGSFHVAYTDGCTTKACLAPTGTPDDSRSSETAVAHLAGWSVYAGGERRPGLAPAP